MTYSQHAHACHLWMRALMDCAAEGRLVCYLSSRAAS